MNSGPYAPPPSDAPPPRPPEGVPTEPEPAPQAPQTGYYPPYPQAGGPPLRQPRGIGPLIAVLVIVVVLIAAIGGYVVGGLAYARSQLNTAHTAYNKVVAHENSLTDTVNSARSKFNSLNVTGSTTTAAFQTFKTAVAGVVSKSQDAQPQIETDDTALADADAGLKQNSWLTILSRSELDKYSAKIGHERKALSAARVLTADYVQLFNF